MPLKGQGPLNPEFGTYFVVVSPCRIFCMWLTAFFSPPVAACIVTGCSWHFILNIILSILWIPGAIHAMYLVYKSDRSGYEIRDPESNGNQYSEVPRYEREARGQSRGRQR